MKKLFFTTVIVFVIISQIFAQSPESFKYQAIIRDDAGTVLSNQIVSFQLSIVEGNQTGTSVYTETFNKTTNTYGLVNLNIGEGTPIIGDFSTIDWGNNTFFLKVELDETGGTNFTHIGTSKLNSVPYSLHSLNTEKIQGKIVSNNMPANGQVLKWNGTEWAPADDNTTGGSGVDGVVDGISFSGTTNKTLILNRSNGLTPLSASFNDEVNDADADATNELQVLNFSNDTLYLSNGGQIFLGNYSNLWNAHGNDIYNTNTKNVGVGLEDPMGKLVVQGDSTGNDTLPLFEVKNKNGQTIFAVYDGGVRVYVRDEGGMYNNNDKGGFAIGGYRLDKTITNEYMRVTPDSVRIYIKEKNTNKNNNDKGGFAIGGYRLDKTVPEEYLNVYAADTAYVLDTTAQMLWYPLKEAFLSGKILVEDADSVGQNSWATGYVSKSIGNYSQALGNQAIARGESSTAIGYHAVADSANSYAFGNNALVQNRGSYAIGTEAKVTGIGSYAIGTSAEAIGDYSFAIGSPGIDLQGDPVSGSKALGDYSYAFGMGSIASSRGAIAFGTQDTSSNYFSLATGYQTKAIGEASFTAGVFTKAIGQESIAMGLGSISDGELSFTFGEEAKTFADGAVSIGYKTIASGRQAVAMGHTTEATNDYSFAIGFANIASAHYSVAMGYNTKASGSAAFSIGYNTEASSFNTVAFGNNTTATSSNSTAMGSHTKAKGDQTTVLGEFNNASTLDEFTIGRYNDTTIASYNGTYNWTNTDPLFLIGNGTDDTNRHNAITILKNGNMGLNDNTPTHTLTINSSASPIDSLTLRLIGPHNYGYGAMLNFGDGNYVYLQENNDDQLKIYADKGMELKTNASYSTTINTNKLYIPGSYNDAVGATNKALYIDDNGLIGFLSSSRRYKKQIKDMENIDWFYKLRPVNYLYKTDKKGIKQYGLIAEEVEKVNKLFVSYNKDGLVETVNYNQFISPMIKVIQEQKKEIENLKAENFANKTISKQNKNEIENLKAEIEQLKQVLEVKAQK